MANIKSAKKRTRQIDKKKIQNGMKKTAVRTYEKKIRRAIAEKKIEDAQKIYRIFCSFIDKAGKNNIVHPNKASRKKSRLAHLLKANVVA